MGSFLWANQQEVRASDILGPLARRSDVPGPGTYDIADGSHADMHKNRSLASYSAW